MSNVDERSTCARPVSESNGPGGRGFLPSGMRGSNVISKSRVSRSFALSKTSTGGIAAFNYGRIAVPPPGAAAAPGYRFILAYRTRQPMALVSGFATGVPLRTASTCGFQVAFGRQFGLAVIVESAHVGDPTIGAQNVELGRVDGP